MREGAHWNRLYEKGTDTHSRLYTLWRAMLGRCTNPRHEAWSRYGGRGITIDPTWLNFGGFREWAIESGYADDLTLDRIDNDAGYSPSNCRWATYKEQARNRIIPLREVEAFGESKPISDWVADPRCRVDLNTLSKRLRAGQPPEFALTATEHEARVRASKLREAAKRVAA